MSPSSGHAALNAGAAIYVSGVAPSLKAGVEAAQAAIRSGAAKRKLEEFVAYLRDDVALYAEFPLAET